MENEIEGIELNSIEKIKLLLLNTKGEPHDIVENLFYSGSKNPDSALDKILRTLANQYGADMNVAKSLDKKIDNFPSITKMTQGKEIRDLLHLCLQIESYKENCAELQRFDLPSGQMSIWGKLPVPIQNRWRHFGNSYEKLPKNTFF